MRIILPLRNLFLTPPAPFRSIIFLSGISYNLHLVLQGSAARCYSAAPKRARTSSQDSKSSQPGVEEDAPATENHIQQSTEDAEGAAASQPRWDAIRVGCSSGADQEGSSQLGQSVFRFFSKCPLILCKMPQFAPKCPTNLGTIPPRPNEEKPSLNWRADISSKCALWSSWPPSSDFVDQPLNYSERCVGKSLLSLTQMHPMLLFLCFFFQFWFPT